MLLWVWELAFCYPHFCGCRSCSQPTRSAGDNFPLWLWRRSSQPKQSPSVLPPVSIGSFSNEQASPASNAVGTQYQIVGGSAHSCDHPRVSVLTFTNVRLRQIASIAKTFAYWRHLRRLIAHERNHTFDVIAARGEDFYKRFNFVRSQCFLELGAEFLVADQDQKPRADERIVDRVG
jgi:hypothetical protein